jgi:hypothetical protein
MRHFLNYRLCSLAVDDLTPQAKVGQCDSDSMGG